MLNLKEYDELTKTLYEIESALNQLPHIDKVEKAFVLTKKSIPDPVRYICKGVGGEYSIVFAPEDIEMWMGSCDMLAEFLYDLLVDSDLDLSTPKSTYVFNDSGFLKI